MNKTLPLQTCKLLYESGIEVETKPKNKQFIDLTWNNYWRWEVLWYAGRKKNSYWYCKCECWNIRKIIYNSLKSWATKSCGCLNIKLLKERVIRHWKTGSIEYKTYNRAKVRCENKNSISYKNYWGRGIKFLFNSFEEFYNELWSRPSNNHSLDRIDYDWNYELWNVRWATLKEQANNKRSTLFYTHNWKRDSLSNWCKELWIDYHLAYGRIRLQWWSFENAIS